MKLRAFASVSRYRKHDNCERNKIDHQFQFHPSAQTLSYHPNLRNSIPYAESYSLYQDRIFLLCLAIYQDPYVFLLQRQKTKLANRDIFQNRVYLPLSNFDKLI